LGALALFGEPIGLAVILGGGITLFGVFLVVRSGD
jgi:drug/metabolite transporter (DMT)-like permease